MTTKTDAAEAVLTQIDEVLAEAITIEEEAAAAAAVEVADQEEAHVYAAMLEAARVLHGHGDAAATVIEEGFLTLWSAELDVDATCPALGASNKPCKYSDKRYAAPVSAIVIHLTDDHKTWTIPKIAKWVEGQVGEKSELALAMGLADQYVEMLKDGYLKRGSIIDPKTECIFADPLTAALLFAVAWEEYELPMPEGPLPDVPSTTVSEAADTSIVAPDSKRISDVNDEWGAACGLY